MKKCPSGIDCYHIEELYDEINILYSAVGVIGIVLLVWAGVILMWHSEAKDKAKNMIILGIILCGSSFGGFMYSFYSYFFQ